MTTILGNDSDNFLRGNLTVARNETLKGFGGNDMLEGIAGNDTIGGKGTDVLVAWGDDTLVGGGTDRYNAQLVTDLGNDPFEIAITPDRQRDIFVAVNKDRVGYTLTIADYEIGIDRVDLRAFGVRSAAGFLEIQDKGSFFELKTPTFNGADLVLRIDADPSSLTYTI